MNAPRRILHLLSSTTPDDTHVRIVQLIDAFGRGCVHSIGAGTIARSRGIAVDPAADFPSLQGRPTPRRLQSLARAMIGHDLVLTYDYGAMDAVCAHTMFGGHLPLPPLVHHEDTTPSLHPLQNWYRRIALGRVAALVVPTPQLEAIAMANWHQPRWRVKRIAPGIRTAAYTAKPRRDALPRVIKRAGELWLGTRAELTSAANLAQLVCALSALPPPWQLVILGEHPQRDAIRDEALRLDLGHRVHWPGAVAEPGQVVGLFDILVVAPDDEPSPTPIMQAMAAGLAIVSTGGGDVAALLAPENRPFVVGAGDEAALATALRTLAEQSALRTGVGAANRARACAEYDEGAMIAAYRAAYGAALGQASFP